jgi:hypothetical protein
MHLCMLTFTRICSVWILGMDHGCSKPDDQDQGDSGGLIPVRTALRQP